MSTHFILDPVTGRISGSVIFQDGLPGGDVSSVNGKTGTVVLTPSDVGAIAEPATAGTAGQVLTKTLTGPVWADAGFPGITLAACSGLGLAQTGSGPAFGWTDPDNVELNGATLATWARTVLVRKVGSYPANWQDGTLMAETSAALGNKNYYRDHNFVDDTQESGQTYYYKLFSVTTAGDWNNLTANEYTNGTGLSWSQVRQYVRAGRGAELFPVGTVFIVDHAEYRHADGTGLWFRVAGHDQVPAVDESVPHTMCLEMVDCLFSLPYDAPEYEYALTWDTVAITGKTYYTYNGSSYTALTEGVDWNPGDPVPAAGWYEKNLQGRNSAGSNNSVQNNQIQWFNSSENPYTWFHQQTPWDLCGTNMLGKNGFLKNIDQEFLAVVQPAKLVTELCRAEGGGNVIHSARFWSLSITQITGQGTQNVRLQYYADGNSPAKHLMNSGDCFVWLRSPLANTDWANNTYVINLSGAITYQQSSYTNGYSPACIIG